MKKNLLILYSVIAVVLVVAPVSYYEFAYDHSSPLPPIYAKYGTGNFTWQADFDNATDSGNLSYYWEDTSTTFWQPGYRNSSLNTGFGVGQAYYDPLNQGIWMSFDVNVSGTMYLSHLPNSVSVRYLFSSNWGINVPSGIVDPVNVSQSNLPDVYYSETLLNRTSNQTFAYHFSFGGYMGFDVYPPGKDIPFNATAIVSLNGLSRPVFTTNVLTLVDTGNKFKNGTVSAMESASSAGTGKGGIVHSEGTPSMSVEAASQVPYKMHGYDGNDAVYMTTANLTSSD